MLKTLSRPDCHTNLGVLWFYSSFLEKKVLNVLINFQLRDYFIFLLALNVTAGEESRVVIKGLEKDQQYKVTVRGMTEDGQYSPESIREGSTEDRSM